MKKRVGLAVWVDHLRPIRHLRRYGTIHYVSNRCKYAVLYVDEEQVDHMVRAISSLNFVRKVEPSHYHEIVENLLKKKEKLTDEGNLSVNL
ncbi:MAG: YlbG family protein [Thermicanus sp.]|nr:YlbG family protein [Thermicanus sp.]